MKVSYYCQHVLGVGHLHRSLEICRHLAARYPTTLILGGPKVSFDPAGLEIFQLPGLQMDENFQNLSPCDPDLSLERARERRRELLYHHFSTNSPDIFITELFPFGRKAFRFELEPLLKAIATRKLAPCKVFSSVRDILVEKTEGRMKFEKKVVETLNSFFDGVLVHSDPKVITLEQTFSQLSSIQIPIYYTGFVGPKAASKQVAAKDIRQRLQLPGGTRLIVASIGGGGVGGKLLESCIAAFELLDQSKQQYQLQIFSGPYLPDQQYQKLQQRTSPRIALQRFTKEFPEWLEAADLSISMAGYNTSINLVAAGIPALIYPFTQNREQQMRAVRLAAKLPIRVLRETDLDPEILAQRISTQLELKPAKSDINIDGAEQTVSIISSLLAHQPLHHPTTAPDGLGDPGFGIEPQKAD
jgi:predicted glycosyltransferase